MDFCALRAWLPHPSTHRSIHPPVTTSPVLPAQAFLADSLSWMQESFPYKIHPEGYSLLLSHLLSHQVPSFSRRHLLPLSPPPLTTLSGPEQEPELELPVLQGAFSCPRRHRLGLVHPHPPSAAILLVLPCDFRGTGRSVLLSRTPTPTLLSPALRGQETLATTTTLTLCCALLPTSAPSSEGTALWRGLASPCLQPRCLVRSWLLKTFLHPAGLLLGALLLALERESYGEGDTDQLALLLLPQEPLKVQEVHLFTWPLSSPSGGTAPLCALRKPRQV